jgi:uncharacterized protein (TIRG00374 family)
MKRIIFFIAIFAILIYYISENIPEITQTFAIAAKFTILGLLLAVIFAALAYIIAAKMYQKIFAVMGIQRNLFEFTKLSLRATAMNVLIPTAGVAAGVVYVEDAKIHDESQLSAVAAFIVAMTCNFSSILLLLLIGTIYLSFVHRLTAFVWVPALILLGYTLIFFLLILLSKKRRNLVKRVSLWCKQLFSQLAKLFRKKVSPDNGIDTFISELVIAHDKIISNKRNLAAALFYVLLSQLLYLIVLFILFISMGLHPQFWVILSGYAVGSLFVIVSPTPSGIGFAEVGMAIVFSSLKITTDAATVVSLLFRGLSFWIPLLIGFALIQKNNLKKITSDIFEE